MYKINMSTVILRAQLLSWMCHVLRATDYQTLEKLTESLTRKLESARFRNLRDQLIFQNSFFAESKNKTQMKDDSCNFIITSFNNSDYANDAFLSAHAEEIAQLIKIKF